MREVKYFCDRKCRNLQLPARDTDGNEITTEHTVTSTENGNGKTVTKLYKTRTLACGHKILASSPGLTDSSSSENLDELETASIRREIDKTMLGKNGKAAEQQLLMWCEVYQVLLKVSSKGVQKGKYAIQYIQQLEEKYAEQLTDEEELNAHKIRFAHFLDQRPKSSNKTLEREMTTVDKAKNVQLAALEAVKALLKGKGHQASNLFNKGE